MIFKLYDINSKKDITLKNISFTDKQKIINGELTIKSKIENMDKFKKELSNDKIYLPMFDIINDKIYLIHKNYIFKSIKHNNMRVLNKDLINFLKNNKYDKKIIDIVNLFDFDILEDLFLNFIYYNSKDIGRDISYFKNPAFIKNADIRPYLKKSSIINTALNTGIIKIKDLPIDENKLEDLYNKIKSYLFTDKILISHKNIIKKHNSESLISFFSLYGAYYINKYLRHKQKYDDNIITNHIKTLNNLISDIPKLDEEKLVFRFISDDSFLNLNKIGDTYINDSFMSCTRKPNINAKNSEFGYILLKINLTTKFKGYFISIESDSVFNKEKEVIIKPGVEFRLKSIDDNVEFYLFEKKYLRSIKKKYELEIINIRNIEIPKYEIVSIPEFEITDIKLVGDTLEEKIDFFIRTYGGINKSCYIKYNNKKKLFYFNHYDSTELYSEFYYYNIKNGFFFFSFSDNSYELDMFIELGDELIINYPSQYLNFKKNDELNLLSALFCNLFEINMIKIFPYYEIVKDSYYRIGINVLLKDIILNKKSDIDIYKLNNIIGYLNTHIDTSNIHFNLLSYINNKTTYKSLILELIKNNNIYLKYLYKSLPIFILSCHYTFYPYEFLLDESYIKFIPDIHSTYLQNVESKNIIDNNEVDFFERTIIKN